MPQKVSSGRTASTQDAARAERRPAGLELAPPRGTNDILPPESWSWQAVMRQAMDIFATAGYAPVETPAFEHTEVFLRGVGETSEVVGKQMYTFEDLGGRSLTLRPEATAPTMRAVLGANLHRGPLPVKLAYAGPLFRQERPQKGRYRQFYTVGIEAIGSPNPIVDAEVIEVGARLLAGAGVGHMLQLNSIGHVDVSCRGGYVRRLVDYLSGHANEIASVDLERIHTNPLRTFDSKEDPTIAVMQEAPLISDHLCADCARHFDEVRGLLEGLGIPYELNPRLVRGLDYYTRTAFEFVAGELGSHNAVGGGGRYDGLSESLGGPALPGIGFGLGVDRILMAREKNGESSPVLAYVVAIGASARTEALGVATELRAHGIGTDLDAMDRTPKAQMKDAARSGARWAVILGDDELARGQATVRDLVSGEQRAVARSDLERSLR